MVKWVHQFFPKAKSAASKQDIPNKWRAMNGPFACEYGKDASKNIETLERIEDW